MIPDGGPGLPWLARPGARSWTCGTPDQVYDQLVDFCEYCGGMGNLLMMGQAGWLSHEDTVDSLTLFAEEVLPRLKEYKQPVAEAPAAA